MVYEMTPKGQAKKNAKEAVKAFRDAVKRPTSPAGRDTTSSTSRETLRPDSASARSGPLSAGYHQRHLLLHRCGRYFLRPFLTSVVGLPMFVAAGTSALAVLISMVLSIFNFMIKGVTVDWLLIIIELVGIFIGSMVGPRTGKYIPEKGLKYFFILLAVYVGLDYILQGFFNIRMIG
jgi:hypothetical protein